MAIREGLWDCQYCAATGIPGRHQACPNCNKSRPEGTKFYLPDEAPEVTDRRQQRRAAVGPDWICGYCAASNPADAAACPNCGAPRAADGPQQAVTTYAPGEAPRSGDMDLGAPARPAGPVAAPRKNIPRKTLLLGAAAGLIVLLLCVFGGILLLGNRDQQVTVARISWERTVQVEANRTVVEEDWSVPTGGRLLSQRQEIQRYDSVLVGHEPRERQVSEQVQVGSRTYVCGQRDLGNGFFEDVECTEPIYETRYRTESYQEPVYQQAPVYATRYAYEIERWVVDQTERAAGEDRQPYWPRISLAENEREGERQEVYRVVFVDEDGREYVMEYPEAAWRTFEQGAGYRLRVSNLGEPLEIIE